MVIPLSQFFNKTCPIDVEKTAPILNPEAVAKKREQKAIEFSKRLYILQPRPNNLYEAKKKAELMAQQLT